MIGSAAEQAYWDSVWERQEPVYDPDQVPFHDLFDRYLKPGGSCFEVGCYPGRFLIYLGQRFGYTVSGIDLTPTTRARVPSFLARHQISVGEIFQGDFFEHPTTEQYDTVCSFGFVEHFYNFEEVIERHIALVKPGGTLVISCPNFRYFQWLLHWMVEPRNLDIHVLKAMNLRAWKRVLERHGMEILHHGYDGAFGFWADMPRERGLLRWLGEKLVSVSWKARHITRLPNRFMSPMMISISRRPLA